MAIFVKKLIQETKIDNIFDKIKLIYLMEASISQSNCLTTQRRNQNFNDIIFIFLSKNFINNQPNSAKVTPSSISYNNDMLSQHLAVSYKNVYKRKTSTNKYIHVPNFLMTGQLEFKCCHLIYTNVHFYIFKFPKKNFCRVFLNIEFLLRVKINRIKYSL